MPKLITIDEISEGMELALPVKNKSGQVLMGSDMKLQDKHKIILKTWGIEYISIKDNNSDTKLNYTDEQVEKAKQLLSQKISWIPRSIFDKELYEIALLKVLENNSKLNSRTENADN